MEKLTKKWLGFYLKKRDIGIEVIFYKSINGVYSKRNIRPLTSLFISIISYFYGRVYINFEDEPKSVLPVFFENIIYRSLSNLESDEINNRFKLVHNNIKVERSLMEGLYRGKVRNNILH